MSRIVSAEEARGLIEAANLLAPFRVGPNIGGSSSPSIMGGDRQQHIVAWGAYAPVAPLFAAAPDLAATVIALSEARAIVNACMGAVPVTTVAFHGDVPLYIRACFAAVAAEHRENVAGLERAVDGAGERIGELVADRDRLLARIADLEAKEVSRG